MLGSRCRLINSLAPSGTIWKYRTLSSLVQVMICCLKALEMFKISICNIHFKITATSHGWQWVNRSDSQCRFDRSVCLSILKSAKVSVPFRCQGVVSLTFHELSKIFSWNLCIAEIILLFRISSWNFVRVPKAMLWSHVQSFSLKFSPWMWFLALYIFARLFWRARETLVKQTPILCIYKTWTWLLLCLQMISTQVDPTSHQ